MVDKKLEEYVAAKKLAGESDEVIRKELLINNWKLEIINEALGVQSVEGENITTPTPDSNYLLSVSELFLASFKIFKDRFWSFVLIMMVPGILMILVGTFIGAIFGIISVMVNQGTAVAVLIALGLLITIPFIVIQMWGSVALITSSVSKEKLSFSDAYKKSWKKITPFFTVNLFVGCILLGGTFLLVIPGIIFSICFIFSSYVYLVDDVKGFKAIMASREIVKGHWWFVFWRLFLVGLIGGLIYLFLTLILKLFGFDTESFGPSIILSVISSIFSVFYLCFTAQLFLNLRNVKGKYNVDVSIKSKVIYTIIGIIGILGIVAVPVVAVLVAINPSKQISNANDSLIKLKKVEINNAITRFYVENNYLPKSLTELVPNELRSIPTGNDKDSCFSVTVTGPDLNIIVNYDNKNEVECNSVSILK